MKYYKSFVFVFHFKCLQFLDTVSDRAWCNSVDTGAGIVVEHFHNHTLLAVVLNHMLFKVILTDGIFLHIKIITIWVVWIGLLVSGLLIRLLGLIWVRRKVRSWCCKIADYISPKINHLQFTLSEWRRILWRRCCVARD
jgi:hypothetical protein